MKTGDLTQRRCNTH